jgi:small subunit ribosomal protein S17
VSSSNRKMQIGQIVSDKMDKTVIVAVFWRQPHRKYGKPIKRTSKFVAHDTNNECKIGDMVRIEETRPLSRSKRWRVREILKSQKFAELQPQEIDVSLLEDQSMIPKAKEEQKEEEKTSDEDISEAVDASSEQKEEEKT